MVIGNGMEKFARQFSACGMGNIAHAQHADEPLFVVDDRETTDLLLIHEVNGVFDRLSRPAVYYSLGHHLSGSGLGRITSLCHDPKRDIPVRDHSNQLVVFPDWNGTDIVLLHHLCDLADGRFGAGPIGMAVHCMGNFHLVPSKWLRTLDRIISASAALIVVKWICVFRQSRATFAACWIVPPPGRRS
jgi:hypothetical protein